MLNKKDYFNYISKNENLTLCQKKYIYNYFEKKNNLLTKKYCISEFIKYLHQIKNLEEIFRFKMLLLHFVNYNSMKKIYLNLLKTDISDYDIIKSISKSNMNKQKVLDEYKICDKWIYALQIVAKQIISAAPTRACFKCGAAGLTEGCGSLRKTPSVSESLNPLNTLPINPSQKYLDIGCGTGKKTKLLAQFLNISKDNTYGADIPSWGPYQSDKSELPFHFSYIENNKLNYPDNTFDFISCILTLHHIPNNKLNPFIKEIKRILKPSGLFILIEHNALTDYDKMLITIQHLLYSALYDKKEDFIENPDYMECYNMYEWNYIMNKNNLYVNTYSLLSFGNEFERQYDNIYYAIFSKK
jgi:SAM-dependent methyltransferase